MNTIDSSFPGTNNESNLDLIKKEEEKKQELEPWNDISTIYERFDQTDFKSIFEFMKVYRYKHKKKDRINLFGDSSPAESSPVSKTE